MQRFLCIEQSTRHKQQMFAADLRSGYIDISNWNRCFAVCTAVPPV